MKSYVRNSPEAAVRVVLLTALVDGQIVRAELETLEHTQACRELGLDLARMREVVSDVCDDLLALGGGDWSAACQVSVALVEGVLDEVTDPDLRRRVLRICNEVVEADRQLADVEFGLLATLIERWGMPGSSKPEGPPGRDVFSY